MRTAPSARGAAWVVNGGLRARVPWPIALVAWGNPSDAAMQMRRALHRQDEALTARTSGKRAPERIAWVDTVLW